MHRYRLLQLYHLSAGHERPCRKWARRYPKDYSLVCFDYSEETYRQEDVTCSVEQGFEMGRQLALRLMEMISTGECDDRNYTYVMKPILYDGHSIRKIQKGKIKILPEASNCSPGESLYRFCCARKCAAVCRRGST